MSFANTVAVDYKVPGHDAGESCTLTTKPAGTTTALTFCDAHELTVDEMAAAGMSLIGTQGKGFSLPSDQISSSLVPKPGDTITDAASVIWEIKRAVQDDLGICWDCDCVRNR